MRRGPSLGRVPAAPVPRRLRYYACATTPCTASPRLISSPAGTTLRLLIRSLSPAGRGGPGPFVSAGGPCSGARTWTVQGLPGSLASHPVAMRTFFDPGRSAGASPLAAPPVLPPLRGRRRHRRLGFRGSIASLHHPLCTLHDVRYRTPCNTRSRLAGSASAGRVSNPLARGEKFQLIASSFPGLALAQPVSPSATAPAPSTPSAARPPMAASPRMSHRGRSHAPQLSTKSMALQRDMSQDAPRPRTPSEGAAAGTSGNRRYGGCGRGCQPTAA